MRCDDFELMLAEALGGELSEADRPAFERHLAECEACRGDYESAQATLARLQSLPAADAQRATSGADAQLAGPAAPHPLTMPLGGSAAMPRKDWAAPAFRYAASILLAFAAGYAANGFRGDEEAADSPLRPPVVGSVQDVQLADASFGAAFAETYQRQPSRSELSRCLTAMFTKQN